MHTIVVHFDKKYEDWHLIEPFFYKLQSNKEITFYWEEEVSASNPLFLSLAERIIEHLERDRIKEWQLMFLVNLYDEPDKAIRLTSKLSEVRKRLLDILKEKGAYPLQTILHLVDMIKRDSGYVPKNDVIKQYWELDQFGFLLSKHGSIRGNAFTLDEIKRLDETWGEPISLQGIVLDQPNHSFMKTLKKKCDQVELELTALINRKKTLYNDRRYRDASDVWMTEDQLHSVWKDFRNRLTQIRKLPLTRSLSNFIPSKELSGSLKYYVGIQHEIGDIRLVRQEVVQGSYRERMRGYLELTYFLLTVSHHPNLIDRLSKGSASVVRITLEEERLDKLLSNYSLSLVRVKNQLEDQLLHQNQFHTYRFRAEEFTPYRAASLERQSGDHHLQPMVQKITPFFFDQWQKQLNKAENSLIDRERELLHHSRDAIKKFNVLKRKEEFMEEEVWVDINDYTQELQQDIGYVNSEVVNSSPFLSDILSNWRNSMTAAKKRMHFLLQRIPNQRQFFICSIITFLIFMMPFLPDFMSRLTGSKLLFAILSSLVLITAIITLGYLFTRRKTIRPIRKLQQETSQYTEKMHQLQVKYQHQYNHYLNHLYQLFSLRKMLEKISRIGEEKKEKNILLRYHLVRLDEFVQAANRLLNILQMNKDQSLNQQETRVPSIKFEKSVMDNPIYCPFQPSGVVQQNNHAIEVYLGSAREQYQSSYMNEIDKIRIKEDKVYKLWN